MPQLVAGLAIVLLIIWAFGTLAALVIQFWYVPAGIVLLIVVIKCIQSAVKNAEEARLGEQARRRQEESEKQAGLERQRQIRATLAARISRAENASQLLPQLIADAEERLEIAKEEFNDRAFAPFWNEIEKAANSLAKADECSRLLSSEFMHFHMEAQQLTSDAPVFTVSSRLLPEPTQATDQLKSLVRTAQKDFQFATIFEQRKTNKLLVSGFSNLADALNSIGDRLEGSISTLMDLLDSSHSELNEKMEGYFDSQRQLEEQKLQMLDNIQRRRRPRH